MVTKVTRHINAQKRNHLIKFLLLIRLFGLLILVRPAKNMTPFKSHFIIYKPVQERHVVVADGSSIKVLGTGNVILKDKTRQNQDMLLKDVLHVNGLQDCLISVAKLNMDGIDAEFRNLDCHLHKNGQLLAKGGLGNGIFQIQDRALKITESDIWHHRFGHTSNVKLANMVKKKQITDVTISGQSSFCDSCARGKAHRLPFSGHEKSSRDEDITHAYIAGPFRAPTVIICY